VQAGEVRLTAQRILTDHVDPRTTDQFWDAIDLNLSGALLVDFVLSFREVRTASFDRATFIGEAWFDGATFTGQATFEDATFIGDTWFDQATFAARTTFDGTAFTGDASFDDAAFTGSLYGINSEGPER